LESVSSKLSFSLSFPNKTVYASIIPLYPHMYHVPYSFILTDFITQILSVQQYGSWSSSSCSSLRPPLLGPDIFLSTLFTLNLLAPEFDI
jgi:hypothetical protein